MTLTHTEAVDLLTAASVYDNRKPDPATVLAWVTASEIGRWSFPAALAALHEHYATRREYLMPAHITEAIRARRVQPPSPDDDLQAITAGTATREHIDRLRVRLGRELSWRSSRAEEPDADRLALAVKCKWCGSLPGEPCTRPSKWTGGGRVRTNAPHPSRVSTAGAERTA